MSVVLKFNLPESVFSAIHRSPQEFTAEMRVAAAVKWYEMQKISQEKAAEIAGLTRSEFINALSDFEVSPFQYTSDQLIEGLKNAN